MNAQQSEIGLMHEVAEFLDGKLVAEFVNQGHHLTGALERSIQYGMGSGVVSSGGRTRAIGNMEKYGVYVNFGVKPGRVPYDGTARTGAGTSQYIQGLKFFWMEKGLSEEEALKAAFATAKVHKKEGMPSMGSYRYTKSGQRLRFVQVTDEKFGAQIDTQMSTGLDAIIDTIFHETKSETI